MDGTKGVEGRKWGNKTKISKSVKRLDFNFLMEESGKTIRKTLRKAYFEDYKSTPTITKLPTESYTWKCSKGIVCMSYVLSWLSTDGSVDKRNS